jgi:hypothetical protein
MHGSDPPSTVAREECIPVSASARLPWGEAWSSPAPMLQYIDMGMLVLLLPLLRRGTLLGCSHHGCPGARLLRPRDRSISGSAGGILEAPGADTSLAPIANELGRMGGPRRWRRGSFRPDCRRRRRRATKAEDCRVITSLCSDSRIFLP